MKRLDGNVFYKSVGSILLSLGLSLQGRSTFPSVSHWGGVTSNTPIPCCSTIISFQAGEHQPGGEIIKPFCCDPLGFGIDWTTYLGEKTKDDTGLSSLIYLRGRKNADPGEQWPSELNTCVQINCELLTALGDAHLWWEHHHWVGRPSCAEAKQNWACLQPLLANSALGDSGDDLFPKTLLFSSFLSWQLLHCGPGSESKKAVSQPCSMWFVFSESCSFRKQSSQPSPDFPTWRKQDKAGADWNGR